MGNYISDEVKLCILLLTKNKKKAVLLFTVKMIMS